MSNKYLIIGNWKMNPGTLIEAKKLAGKFRRTAPELKNIETVICPPFPFLLPLTPKNTVRNFHMGAQSASNEELGSHTGMVSALMLKDIGVEYVIVGHSEERKRGDTNEIVSKKLLNVLNAGLTAVVCVGEDIRDADGAYMEGLKNQIKDTFANVPKKFAKNIVIAYEPVWAIGGAEAMKPEDVYETSLFVKKVFADVFTPDVGVKVNVLYGGSVNFHNAPEIIRIGQVDGLLVGRESVSANGFVDLLKAVDTIN
jgi:triosephosphate isomerase